MKRAALLLVAASLLVVRPARTALAGERLPGEAAELTDKVRAEAQGHLALLVKGGADAEKARRALVVLGPVVWPVVENTLRLTPTGPARPHLQFLKALLAAKAEPEFEALRDRLRRKVLMGDMNGVLRELNDFRAGRPDPDHRGLRLPPKVPVTTEGKTKIFRSSDGSLVIAFGGDATAKDPDAPAVAVTDPAAGFVAAVGGKAEPHSRRSGRGADATARAPNGFAWAWATDGAPGVAPGGIGGEGGVAQTEGGAGQHARSGSGGAGAAGAEK